MLEALAIRGVGRGVGWCDERRGQPSASSSSLILFHHRKDLKLFKL